MIGASIAAIAMLYVGSINADSVDVDSIFVLPPSMLTPSTLTPILLRSGRVNPPRHSEGLCSQRSLWPNLAMQTTRGARARAGDQASRFLNKPAFSILQLQTSVLLQSENSSHQCPTVHSAVLFCISSL